MNKDFDWKCKLYEEAYINMPSNRRRFPNKLSEKKEIIEKVIKYFKPLIDSKYNGKIDRFLEDFKVAGIGVWDTIDE